jgi:CheY-like chemotaxis protein
MKTRLVEDKLADRLLASEAMHEIGSDVGRARVMQSPGTPELPEPPKAAKIRSAATILFVEDEEMIRTMTKVYLEGNGYRVIEACDGTDAVLLWQEHQADIDLVVTDLEMPGVNGRQLVQRLKAERPDLKAIFVSGYTSGQGGEEAAADGSAKFLPKPYRLKNLTEMVQDCLSREDPE